MTADGDTAQVKEITKSIVAAHPQSPVRVTG